MLTIEPTPLVRLCNLFSEQVYVKCEYLAMSGCFKIRGAAHLLERLDREGRSRHLVVPSMGNTALGAAAAAQAMGFTMTGVVPQSISSDKDAKLRAMGVELVKLDAGGSELLKVAKEIAADRNGYFVHPHLDPDWTDGYAQIAAEILQALPDCRTLVFPVGGGGLLLGLLKHVRETGSDVRLVGCEPYAYPKYAAFDHQRTSTIADGLRLESPHAVVQQAIAENSIHIGLVSEAHIRGAMRALYGSHGMAVEPSSAIAVAYIQEHLHDLEPPICAILTGQNITQQDHARLMAEG
jgi:threonine dehydratase